MKTLLLAIVAGILASQTLAADVIQLEGISILGSTEESKIMTITSWKTPPEIEIPFDPIEGFQEDRLEPLQPRKFHLEVDYARRFQTGIGNLTEEGKGTR